MKSSSKRKTDWITSSFGAFGQGHVAKKAGGRIFSKNTNPATTKYVSNQDPTAAQLSWVEKYKPLKEVDLVVHKKKYAEVKQWLLRRFDSSVPRGSSNVLVLNGPAGAGKTATVHVLSKELNVEIQEWNTPVSLSNEEFTSWKDFRGLRSESQRKQFHDFLLRANKYPTLSMTEENSISSHRGQKIILVEDIPNVFQKNTRDFHEILRKFQAQSRNPLVFVMSDSYVGESNFYNLFPKNIQMELQITCISFNPVAPTSLTKHLSKIVAEEIKCAGENFVMPSKDTLDVIAANSSGDIRACINSLQFVCTNKYPEKDHKVRHISSDKPAARKSKKDKQLKVQENTILCSKDTSLLLFRSLGKILYCKREETSMADKTKQLPKNLHDKLRDKLLIDPEAVIEKTHVTSDNLILYLHQNYLAFFNDVEDAILATDSLSDADFVTGNWSYREIMKNYSGSLATRGLIFANKGKADSFSSGKSAGGWRPLHKPKWFEIFKETNCNKRNSDELFHDLRYPAVELYLDVLPYLARTNVPLRTPSHIAFVQMISHFSVNSCQQSFPHDAMSEYFADADESTDTRPDLLSGSKKNDDQISLSQVVAESRSVEDEFDTFEDNLIEDFSDEDELLLL